MQNETETPLNGFMASPVTLDYQLNYSDDLIYIGETYHTAEGDKGRMHRISTRRDERDEPWPYYDDVSEVSNWKMTTLSKELTGSLLPPITTPAMAVLDKEENIWVYFGTGRYFNNADKDDTSDQYFLGVIDSYNKDGRTDPVNLTATSNANDYEILLDGTVNQADITFSDLVTGYKEAKGWYITLGLGTNSGERLLTKPSILGGILLFTTFKPDNDICGHGGTSYLYALYYETRTAHIKAAIGRDDAKNLRRISLQKGKASVINLVHQSGILPPASFKFAVTHHTLAFG